MVVRAWIATHRARRRLRSLLRAPLDREAIVRAHAPGRSWLDVGCMWSVDGRICFVAEEAGATAITGVDVIEETPAFRAEHGRRASRVRFVHGDLHDEETLAAAGRHDVVWCSGVLYHAPNPILTLQRLRSVTGERLLLATEIVPEVPGLRGVCVLYPALHSRARLAYRRIPAGRAVGVTVPFDLAEGYGNWFWGITPSALDGMLRIAGFEPERRWRASPFHLTIAARPVPG